MQEIKLHVATWGSHCLLCASENDTHKQRPGILQPRISICVNDIGTWHVSHLITERDIPPGQSITEELCSLCELWRDSPPKWLRVHFCDRNLKCVYVLMSVAMHVCDWVYTYMYIQYRIEANAASLSPHQVSFSKQTSLHLRSHPYLLPLNK